MPEKVLTRAVCAEHGLLVQKKRSSMTPHRSFLVLERNDDVVKFH